MRDSQRSKVYRWTWNCLPEGDLLTLDKCKELIYEICDNYGRIYKPYINDGRGCRWARGASYKVTLPRWARRLRTVLHESVHVIVGNKPWHGPEFVAIFIDLVVQYKLATRKELMASARQYKLKIARAGKIEKPIRKTKMNEAIKVLKNLTPRERSLAWNKVGSNFQ